VVSTNPFEKDAQVTLDDFPPDKMGEESKLFELPPPNG